MASRWQRGLMGLAALGIMGLQACIVVPARRVSYGYGGSGYVPYVDAGMARAQCVHQAREGRGYRGVQAGAVTLTGPETAHVRLHARAGLFERYELDCTYNARTGYAFVP
jgi:hypothetical protein